MRRLTRYIGQMNRSIRQVKIEKFVKEAFGMKAFTIHERISRFIEESIELAQAENFSINDIIKIAEHVYSKPKGKPIQEVGDVSITLLAYCACADISAEMAEIERYNYIQSLPLSYFRERHNAKAEKGIAVKVDK